jgi:hypothetical protein
MVVRLFVLSMLLVHGLISNSQAAIVLSLTSTGDLTNVTVGQTVRVDVQLTGLAPAESLDFLAASVSFDSTVLGTPVVNPGVIVPDPTAPAFVGLGLPGLADASYDSIFSVAGEFIVNNGVFFSFDVAPLAPGSTELSITFADGSVDGVPTRIGSSDSLNVTVVPEVSTWIMVLSAVPFFLCLHLLSDIRCLPEQ